MAHAAADDLLLAHMCILQHIDRVMSCTSSRFGREISKLSAAIYPFEYMAFCH
jgi:hypothetical protein